MTTNVSALSGARQQGPPANISGAEPAASATGPHWVPTVPGPGSPAPTAPPEAPPLHQAQRPPRGETGETQERTKEELKNMHITRSKDTKRIEEKMVATFYTQRSDIIKGMETPVLVREWPYLFDMCGMMAHFKELTGMDVDKEAMSRSSPLTAGHFMVAVDQTIVNGSVPNVVDALMLMFAAYYCLNISYPTELEGTLEFLQR
ncbi:hypothetical protein NQZ68_014277 [Dissostichus eleginoides]|nr:hypothetical protein NQZ68_014277 [Dissostichus eleginoides]